MARVGFIGLGKMGGHMARNLLKAGHEVRAFDPAAAAMDAAVKAGAKPANGAAAAADGAEAVVTMLPAGPQSRAVYFEAGVIEAAGKGALLLDCSTIDIATAQALHEAAAARGLDFLDAPVSGGVVGAERGTLTFMCGGSASAFERARPILEGMGKSIVHAGGPGHGQAAKLCNQMMLGISMLGVAEAFVLAEKVGLDARKLFDIVSTSSGQSFAMTGYCPVPGLSPTAASNNGFKPGFTTAMMLKDLRLAQQAARDAGSASPMGAQAAALFALFHNSGNAEIDYSAVIEMIRGTPQP
jgi:3-hydroxyisobutyrate dehydrogenase